MYSISINAEKCNKCQKCTRVCSIGVIKSSDKKTPEILATENCFRCGHCVAVCKPKAIEHSEFNYNNLITKNENVITGDKIASFLATKRSCRIYKEQTILPDTWKKLLVSAAHAPSAFNCEDRAITVISDKNILKKIKIDLIKKIKKNLKLLKILQVRPFSWIFHKSTIEHFKKICLDFESTLHNCSQGIDALFHNAPHLVLVSSVGMDPLGKDNSLAAGHYVMLQAQSMGIGSAINGFVQNTPKIISKHVKLPFMHKVFFAFTIGYPTIEYERSTERKEVLFNMI